MSGRKRKSFSGTFKAKVALEATREIKMVNIDLARFLSMNQAYIINIPLLCLRIPGDLHR